MSLRKFVRLLPTVALVILWVVLLRPQFLGGPAAYMMVMGKSMEPTLSTGDLAVLRRQAGYSQGDIVAYGVRGGIIIHRIVAGNAGEGFVTQGDNVDSVDLWRPRPENIAGKMWFHVPYLGHVFALLRQPFLFAAAAASLVAFAMLSQKIGSRRDRQRARLRRRGKRRRGFLHSLVPMRPRVLTGHGWGI